MLNIIEYLKLHHSMSWQTYNRPVTEFSSDGEWQPFSFLRDRETDEPEERAGSESPDIPDPGQNPSEVENGAEGGSTTDPQEPDPVQADSAPAAAGRPDIFRESFEDLRGVQDLQSGDRWTGAQLVRGEIDITDQMAHTGEDSFHMQAGNGIGKAHLFKAGYEVDEGDTVVAKAQFWFTRNADLDDVYIMDWESKSAWSAENARPNPQPGIRIGLYDGDGRITVERGKMGVAREQDFVGSDIDMPRDQWVEIEWRMLVGLGDEGATQVLVNGDMVVDARGETYINRDIADANGIALNDEFSFDRFKIGITANSSSRNLEMAVDDIEVMVWDEAVVPPDWF